MPALQGQDSSIQCRRITIADAHGGGGASFCSSKNDAPNTGIEHDYVSNTKDKPNLLPFSPMLVGVQFLTLGFLLQYLFTRTSERSGSSTEGTGTPAVVYQLGLVLGGGWERC